MGYPYGQKGWRVYDLATHDFFVSRDVNFFESQFPFHQLATVQNSDIPSDLEMENSFEEANNQAELTTHTHVCDRGALPLPQTL